MCVSTLGPNNVINSINQSINQSIPALVNGYIEPKGTHYPKLYTSITGSLPLDPPFWKNPKTPALCGRDACFQKGFQLGFGIIIQIGHFRLFRMDFLMETKPSGKSGVETAFFVGRSFLREDWWKMTLDLFQNTSEI